MGSGFVLLPIVLRSIDPLLPASKIEVLAAEIVMTSDVFKATKEP